MLSFSITFRAWQILEAPLPHPPKKSTPQPTEFQVILNMFESSCSSCDMSIFLDGFSEINLLHILGLTQIAFTALQEFQLRTSERARQHACNNVGYEKFTLQIVILLI